MTLTPDERKGIEDLLRIVTDDDLKVSDDLALKTAEQIITDVLASEAATRFSSWDDVAAEAKTEIREELIGIVRSHLVFIAGSTGNAATIAWLKRQLEHNDWDNSIERMGGGKKAHDAYMNPIFDTACAVTAFDMHAQLTNDGRERGLWIWLRDESKARAATYDKWASDALDMFCTLAGIDDETSAKFRLSMAMDEFKRVANAKVHEAALLEWPAMKKMYTVIGNALTTHATKEGR